MSSNQSIKRQGNLILEILLVLGIMAGLYLAESGG
jgi:hypothetical protein